jgi:hypothetical protein
MSLQKQKIILVICCVALFSAPFFVSAGGLVPCGGDNQSPCTVKDIFVLIAKVTNYLIAMGGVFAVYQMIIAGFNLIVFAGGNEEAITTNKNAITNAIVGFILTLMAFMIINTVVNVLLTRSLATRDPNCRLNLTDPLTYLNIDASKCSNQPEPDVHTK